jgi:hypothetical protein
VYFFGWPLPRHAPAAGAAVIRAHFIVCIVAQVWRAFVWGLDASWGARIPGPVISWILAGLLIASLPFRREMPPEDRFVAPAGAQGVLGAFVVGATLAPFLQALASRSADASYETVRGWLRRNTVPGPTGHRIRGERNGTGATRFLLPGELPDAALRALATTDLQALGAPPSRDSDEVLIIWDETCGTWERHT